MNTIIYNIPPDMFEVYRGRPVVVRTGNPLELTKHMAKEDLENLCYIQLISFTCNVHHLPPWAEQIPLELVMETPLSELPLLYNYSQLLHRQPVRVSIPVATGFGKAVKLAVSLNFAVKLEVQQPEKTLVEEMSQVLSFYLHHSTVSQPIEYFHSALFAFYHDTPITLWAIQEEDPACFRYVTQKGDETISRRFERTPFEGDPVSFVAKFKEKLLGERAECSVCEFIKNCGGYFKWPDKTYSCEGVISLFKTLKYCAKELKADLTALHGKEGEPRR